MMDWILLSGLDQREQFRYISAFIIFGLASFIFRLIIPNYLFAFLLGFGVALLVFTYSGKIYDRLYVHRIEQQVKNEQKQSKAKLRSIDVANCPSCTKPVPKDKKTCPNCGFDVGKYK